MNLKKLFLNFCKKNNLEINPNQLELVDQLNNFYNLNFNKSFLKKIFSNDYLGALQTFIDEIQRFYIIKAESALNQMKKVDIMLNDKIKEL